MFMSPISINKQTKIATNWTKIFVKSWWMLNNHCMSKITALMDDDAALRLFDV